MRKFLFESLKRAEAAPLLLATYPILALLSNNITQMDAGVALRPWIVSVAVALILFWVL